MVLALKGWYYSQGDGIVANAMVLALKGWYGSGTAGMWAECLETNVTASGGSCLDYRLIPKAMILQQRRTWRIQKLGEFCPLLAGTVFYL